MYHDLNNHLRTANNFIIDEKIEKANLYIANIGKLESSNNPIIMVIERAKNNINFKYKADIDKINISEDDLCSFIGNILDNTIKTAILCETKINFHIRTKGNICSKNSHPNTIATKNDKFIFSKIKPG